MRKSVGAETTFERDLSALGRGARRLSPGVRQGLDGVQRAAHAGRTVTVKVKYADFQQITRSRSCPAPVAARAELERISLDLLRPLFPSPRGVRLLGVTLSNLGAEAAPGPVQMTLGLG